MKIISQFRCFLVGVLFFKRKILVLFFFFSFSAVKKSCGGAQSMDGAPLGCNGCTSGQGPRAWTEPTGQSTGAPVVSSSTDGGSIIQWLDSLLPRVTKSLLRAVWSTCHYYLPPRGVRSTRVALNFSKRRRTGFSNLDYLLIGKGNSKISFLL